MAKSKIFLKKDDFDIDAIQNPWLEAFSYC